MIRTFALLALLSAALGALCFASRGVIALDFRAFYCAGLAWDHKANPYHTEPLYGCELHQTDDDYSRLVPNAALPAPLPGYDIAGFGLLGRLPFALAKLLWGAILGLCIAISVFALVRLTEIRVPVIFAVLATALAGPSLALGQIVPIYFAAASMAMMFAALGKYRCAAIAAAASLIEPHLGLPICIGLAFWIPQSRATLALAVGALCAVAVAALGATQNIEYVTTVLPLHALSELTTDSQISFSVLMHGLGFSDVVALRAGVISYIIATSAGVCLGGLVAKRLRNAAFVMAVPAATCLIGGSFLHATDIVAAIPLVLCLYVHSAGFRRIHVTALVLLAAPLWAVWQAPSSVMAWFAFAAITTLYVTQQLVSAKPLTASLWAAAIFLGLLLLSVSYHRQRLTFLQQPHAASTVIAERYPEATWARLNLEMFSVEGSAVWLSRLPIWAGLALASGSVLAVTPLKRQFRAVT